MVKGLILTGGKSTRMGFDKYAITYRGKPHYLYLAEQLGLLEIPVALSCSLEQVQSLDTDLPLIPDRYPDTGPMGGILSAMEAFANSTFLVIACDLPFISADAINKLLTHRDDRYHATLYQRTEGWYESAFAIYEPSCYGLLAAQHRSGNYKLQQALKKLNVNALPVESNKIFYNVNTTDDLEAFRSGQDLE
ncbi:MAG: molybdenum cofactor guanylyltransferase [Cyclobacteriaceae bacterium]